MLRVVLPVFATPAHAAPGAPGPHAVKHHDRLNAAAAPNAGGCSTANYTAVNFGCAIGQSTDIPDGTPAGRRPVPSRGQGDRSWRCGLRLALVVALCLSPLLAEQGARYLIITPVQFAQAAQPLADWKTSKGMLAKIVTTAETGTDSVSIRNYILSAHYSWPVPPEYVLLLGAPTFIQSAGNRSDCWFGDLTGDYKMEIPVGRFPAWNVHECSMFVAKVLAYENPAEGGDTTWYLKGTTVLREDAPPDSWYQPDSRLLRQYWTANGYAVAESLADFTGNTSNDVTVAAQDGRAFITYRGIGTGVWYPPFHYIDPYTWTNGAKMPIVISGTCACLTLAPGESMYGDKFVRAGSPVALGGAIACFGPTMATGYGSPYRSAGYRGFFHALYEEGIWRLGTATMRGRFRVDSLYPGNWARYMEWNLLGDPEMNVWTAVPKRLTVEHDTTMLMAACQFGVSVRSSGAPVSGAIVCASMDSAVYAWDTTDVSGQAALAVDPTHPGVMSVVVTGRNLRPYIGDCEVISKDVTCDLITAPAGVVDSGSLVIPACRVYNAGSRPETYRVRMRIGSQYEDSVLVTDHQPGTYQSVGFHDWVALTRGRFSISCSTLLALDQEPGNDRISGNLVVRVRDVGATAITAPVGVYPLGSIILPGATWHNYGNTAATFRAFVRLDNAATGRSYQRLLDIVGLGPDSDTCPDGFSPCTLDAGGRWTVRCSTYLPYDVKPGNDVIAGSCAVGPTWPAGWSAAAPVPPGLSGLAVKDGGWLAADGEYGSAYAGKGSKTSEVYRYDAAADSWQPCAPIPDGLEKKKPGKGAAAAADGAGHVYLTKGNNTRGFWEYDAGANSWTQKQDVPLGLSNKKVKGGTDIVWAYNGGAGSAYLLKGYKNEFYRYDPVADSWHVLQPAPVGANVKWDKGSWLAYDGAHTIYAHKAKYHEFYAYNTETGLWCDTLTAMPIPGSAGTKKSKDGGCASWQDGAIYALKGGGTQEFWQYKIPSGSWTELAGMPLGLNKKKVKSGADITGYGYGVFFALKGNKTNEFWRYVATPTQSPQPAAGGVEASSLVVHRSSFIVFPNPLASGFATVRFSSPFSTPFSLRIYDATGRLVRSSFGNRSSSFRLDLRSMPVGVYLVKFAADGFTATQKLVVQR